MRLTVSYMCGGRELFKSTSSRDYQPIIPSESGTIKIDDFSYVILSVEHQITTAKHQDDSDKHMVIINIV